MIHDLNNVFQNLVEAADLLSGDPRWESVGASILRNIERGREITMSMYAIREPWALFQTVVDNAVLFVEDGVLNTSFIEGYNLNELAAASGPTSPAGLAPSTVVIGPV
jgi:hypothetical protein